LCVPVPPCLLFFFVTRRPRMSTSLPYTTLFRSEPHLGPPPARRGFSLCWLVRHVSPRMLSLSMVQPNKRAVRSILYSPEPVLASEPARQAAGADLRG